MDQKVSVQAKTKICETSERFDSAKVQRSEILDRIFVLLVERGISQKEFAAMLQVSPQTITDWKKGKNSSFMKKLVEIAIALKTTAIWLFSGEGIKSTFKIEPPQQS